MQIICQKCPVRRGNLDHERSVWHNCSLPIRFPAHENIDNGSGKGIQPAQPVCDYGGKCRRYRLGLIRMLCRIEACESVISQSSDRRCGLHYPAYLTTLPFNQVPIANAPAGSTFWTNYMPAKTIIACKTVTGKYYLVEVLADNPLEVKIYHPVRI